MDRAETKTSAPRIIGLTGGLASGKSTVGRLLRQMGAEVIDADQVAREVVEPGLPAYHAIVAAFGREVLSPGPGAQPIDRARLAERVFSDEEARRRLNAITHPEIAAESARRISAAGARGVPVVIYEATLIVENGLYRGLSGVIVVDLSAEEQVRRAVVRGLSESQARLRLMAQAERAARLAVADWVIDNSGSEEQTRAQVAQVWADIQAGRRPARSQP